MQITTILMSETQITVREFLRNYKKLATTKKTIIITKNGKPEGVFMPYEEWDENEKSFKITQEMIDQFSFKGGDPDLSQNIDEICYPYPNELKNNN